MTLPVTRHCVKVKLEWLVKVSDRDAAGDHQKFSALVEQPC
jgi:hypothetical protein